MISAWHGGQNRVPRRHVHAVVEVVRGDARVARWSLRGTDRPDLAVVEALARLQLAGRRLGYSIRLRRPCPALSELLDLAGLGTVVGGGGRQPLGQPEGGEQAGVHEVVEPGDPVA